MASLDDFFAKRDKKKGKAKKFTTTDEIAKKIEEGGKKVEKAEVKPKKDRPKGDEENPTDVNSSDAGDEWKDYKEQTEKDYSGLKIQKLQIAEPDNEPEKTEAERQEAAQEISRGVWKVQGAEEGAVVEEPQKPVTPEPEPPKVEPSAPSGDGPMKSSYVPPHLRNRSEASSGPTRAPVRSRPRVAPDINNEEFFPSLGQVAGNAKSS